MIKRIFVFGINDGTFSDQIEPDYETDYLCESFLGFLGNIALSEREHPEMSYAVIDKYIGRILKLYHHGL